MNESYENPFEKTVPVQHFLIDYRYMILGNTIRNNLDDSKFHDQFVMSNYNMHYLIYKITKKYGKMIEQNDTLRAIIDTQFYERTKFYFNK